MPFLNRFRDMNNCPCGLIFYLENLHIPLPVPLKDVKVNAKVVGFVSEIEVQQEYVNRETRPIEAVYMFPIEEEAAVVEMEAEIDGRKIRTVIKEKEEARKDYDQAVSNQQTAVLMEETKPDIFQLKVGHLKPGAGAKITLKYISELPVEDNASKLTIPTTIGPRYVPAKDNSEEAKKIASIPYSFDSPAPVQFKIECLMTGKIKSLASPSHSITKNIALTKDENGYYKAEAKLAGMVADMNKDFVLLIESKDSDKPVFYLETSEKNKSTAAMVSMIPSFKLDEQKVELIFLVDRSGSMRGQGITQAKAALNLFLHSLPADCYYNIFSFGSRFDSIFQYTSEQYTDDSLKTVKNHVATMDANYGGTEIYRPLEAIFRQPRASSGHLRQVFVLTDGQVSNVEQVISLVKKHNHEGRVFALGLGSGVSRHLIKGIARAGGGTAVFAQEGEDLRPKVMKQLANALQPAMNDVDINWEGIKSESDVSSADVETKKTLFGYRKPKEDQNISLTGQAPSNVPPIYDGTRLLLYYLFENGEKPSKMTLTANSPDGPLTADVVLDEAGKVEGDFIHQLAARKKIQDLEEGQIGSDEAVKKAIIELGCKYNLVSKHTSYIGVDERESNRFYQSMVTRDVPNQYPFHSGFAGFGSAGGRASALMRCAPSGGMFGQMQQQQPMTNSLFGGSAQQNQSFSFGVASSSLPQAPPPPMAKGFSFGASAKASDEMHSFGSAAPVPMAAASTASVPTAGGFSFGGPGAPPPAPAADLFGAQPSQASGMFGLTGMSKKCSMKKKAANVSETKYFDCDHDGVDDNDKEEEEPMDVSSSDRLMTLIENQKTNGAFQWSKEIEVLLKSDKEALLKENSLNVNEEIWITALVVNVMEILMSEHKDLWELVIKKAKKYLLKELDEKRLTDVLKVASDIVDKCK